MSVSTPDRIFSTVALMLLLSLAHLPAEGAAGLRQQRRARTSAPGAQKDAARADANQSAPKIPDAVVYNQEGRRLKFYTDLVKGRTVAVNFIFTTCTTICPPLTANFRKVQEHLGERAGKDVHLISISVDPTTDTPERLMSYSQKFKAGPGWTFVTGDKAEIDGLLKAFGAAAADKKDHTPMILIGNDAAGHWTRAYGLAPASKLSALVVEAASKKATP